jgi:serine/threonine protein kinase
MPACSPNHLNALPQHFRKADSAPRLLFQITLAVHYAHQHGVLHGDLSPSNILSGQPQGGDRQSELVPYVADFLGLSVQEESEWQGGKLDYMAPEKAAGESGLY